VQNVLLDAARRFNIQINGHARTRTNADSGQLHKLR